VLKQLNKEKKSIKEKIESFDNQKPDKLKKQQVGVVPQDEEELDKMIH